MDRDEAEELLRTLFADPGRARSARRGVSADPDPALASIGHQVVGIVSATSGRPTRAAGAADGPALARRSGDRGRCGRRAGDPGHLAVRRGGTRGPAAPRPGVDRARRGTPRARARATRHVLGHLLARFEESAADLRRAQELFAGSGDHVWEDRALNLEGLVDVGLGDLEAAAEAFAGFGEIAAPLGDQSDIAVASTTPGGWPSCGATCRARSSTTPPRPPSTRGGMTNVDLVFDQVARLPSGRARPTRSTSSSRAGRPTAAAARGGRPAAGRRRGRSPRTTGTAPVGCGQGSSLLRAQPGASTGWRPSCSPSPRGTRRWPPAPLLDGSRARRADARGAGARAAAVLLLGARPRPGPVGPSGRTRAAVARRRRPPPRDHRFGRASRLAGAAQRRATSAATRAASCAPASRPAHPRPAARHLRQPGAPGRVVRPRRRPGRAGHPDRAGRRRRPPAAPVVGTVARDALTVPPFGEHDDPRPPPTWPRSARSADAWLTPAPKGR